MVISARDQFLRALGLNKSFTLGVIVDAKYWFVPNK